MKKEDSNDKVIPITRGVEQTTIKHDDGTEEVIEGSYTMQLASGGFTTLFGLNRSTATEYKRIADHGFTDQEIERMENNGPFSADPSVDCKYILSQLTAVDMMTIMDIKHSLDKLLLLIGTPDNGDHESDFDTVDNHAVLAKNFAWLLRMPGNLRLAGMLKEFRLSGKRDEDLRQVHACLDEIASLKIKKFPGT